MGAAEDKAGEHDGGGAEIVIRPCKRVRFAPPSLTTSLITDYFHKPRNMEPVEEQCGAQGGLAEFEEEDWFTTYVVEYRGKGGEWVEQVVKNKSEGELLEPPVEQSIAMKASVEQIVEEHQLGAKGDGSPPSLLVEKKVMGDDNCWKEDDLWGTISDQDSFEKHVVSWIDVGDQPIKDGGDQSDQPGAGGGLLEQVTMVEEPGPVSPCGEALVTPMGGPTVRQIDMGDTNCSYQETTFVARQLKRDKVTISVPDTSSDEEYTVTQLPDSSPSPPPCTTVMTGEDKEEELIPATPDPSIGRKIKRGERGRMTGKKLNLESNNIDDTEGCGDIVFDDTLVGNKDKDISAYHQQSDVIVDVWTQGGQTPGTNTNTQEGTFSARNDEVRTSTPTCQSDIASLTDKEEEREYDRKDDMGDQPETGKVDGAVGTNGGGSGIERTCQYVGGGYCLTHGEGAVEK